MTVVCDRTLPMLRLVKKIGVVRLMPITRKSRISAGPRRSADRATPSIRLRASSTTADSVGGASARVVKACSTSAPSDGICGGPSTSVRIFVLVDRLWKHLDAVAGRERQAVAPAPHDRGFAEVLVQVVDPLDHAVLERPAHGDEVKRREVLDVLAETDAPGMRADGDSKLRGEEQHGYRLVHAAEPAPVALADVDRLCLEELLEDDPVLDVLAGGDPDRRDRAADPGVPEHVVRARRLLDPPRIQLA